MEKNSNELKFLPKRSVSPIIESSQEKPKGAKEQIFQAVLDGDVNEFNRIYNICKISKKGALQKSFNQIQEKFDELIYASMLHSSNNKEGMVAYLVSLSTAEQIAISSDISKNYLRPPISPFREDAVGWMRDSLAGAAENTRNYVIVESIKKLRTLEFDSPSAVAQQSSPSRWVAAGSSSSKLSGHVENLNTMRAKSADGEHKK